MNTKLTLTLDKNIINDAKKYAHKNHMSLSRLVEFYFSSLLSIKIKDKEKLAPITSKLSGMLKGVKIKNEKEILSDILSEKYL